MSYDVVVGLRGSVYAGSRRKDAIRAYRRAVSRAVRRNRRISVVLFRDGMAVREFDGALEQMGWN